MKIGTSRQTVPLLQHSGAKRLKREAKMVSQEKRRYASESKEADYRRDKFCDPCNKNLVRAR